MFGVLTSLQQNNNFCMFICCYILLVKTHKAYKASDFNLGPALGSHGFSCTITQKKKNHKNHFVFRTGLNGPLQNETNNKVFLFAFSHMLS